MSPISVHIKHAGKVYDLQLDPDLPPSVFKDAVYHATGVPPDRMKVMVKGGVLKDDTNWKKIGPKEGQTFTVIGAAGELPQPPPKPVVFLEDMDDSELAETLAKPVGLTNLGNTCYMNATVQALRALPELQVALNVPALQSPTPLPVALRDLYINMSQTTDSIVPRAFLDVLRQVNPQFAETDRSENPFNVLRGGGYAQQDAEECYACIINTLRNVPGLDSSGSSSATGPEAQAGGKKFVDQFLMGEIRRELKCNESPEEPATVVTEQTLKMECNISKTTSFMLNGIMDSLDTEVEKFSPTLGRNAIYSQKSRLTRLPGYLTVHMVRFAWKADIGKKAKILRQVKFPLEFDALELATDELKARLLPASRKIKEVEKERAERRKVRKRTKVAGGASSSSSTAAAAGGGSGDVEMSDATPAAATATVTASNNDDTTTKEEKGKGPVLAGDLEDESIYRTKEAAEFAALVDSSLKKDLGCSTTGFYELVAIVTHKGAAADSGHYIGFVKKSVFHAAKPYGAQRNLSASIVPEETHRLLPDIENLADPGARALLNSLISSGAFNPGRPRSEGQRTGQEQGEGEEAGRQPTPGPSTSSSSVIDNKALELEDDGDWYKFDDEKVTHFPKEKLRSLEGGGEDASAYVLVYRSKAL